jgi:hypothetical protein
VDIPPDSVQNQASTEAINATLAAVGQGTGARDSSRHKLMHRTETLDYGILVQGELWLVLDDDEIRLKPEDVVVQRGT